MSTAQKQEIISILSEIRELRSKIKDLDFERKKGAEEFRQNNPEYRECKDLLKEKVALYRKMKGGTS